MLGGLCFRLAIFGSLVEISVPLGRTFSGDLARSEKLFIVVLMGYLGSYLDPVLFSLDLICFRSLGTAWQVSKFHPPKKGISPPSLCGSAKECITFTLLR